MSDERRTFILRTKAIRARCAGYVMEEAPDNFVVVARPEQKRRIQEEKYHAQIADIARQTKYAGRQWSELHMKRILIDEFAEEMRLAGTPLHAQSALIPSENGRRVIQLEIHSSEFYVGEAAQFIEFLNAWGAERGVVWKNERRQEAPA